MLQRKYCVLIFAMILTVITAEGQLHYRIEAEFTIKEKGAGEYENLMMGRVYYDKTTRNLVYDFQFPNKELLVITDSATYSSGSQLTRKHNLNENLINFSILHLFLNGELEYYGLDNTPFKLSDVEKDGDLVISTWQIKEKNAASQVSKLLLSQKNGNLQGLITFGLDEEILSKQIFSEYIEVEGLSFPSQVLQINYLPTGGELKKITSYRNIKLNNASDNSIYRFKIPVN